MPMFSGLMQYLRAKHNMLWFMVDRPYGQRYFCICGCKETVMFVTLAAAQQRKTRGQEKPPFFRSLQYLSRPRFGR